MCVLEILEILGFGTTARRGRPRGSCRQAGLSEFLIGCRQFLIRGEPILDFPMCFLEILEILDFETTARRGRSMGVLLTSRIVRILDWRQVILD